MSARITFCYFAHTFLFMVHFIVSKNDNNAVAKNKIKE